MNGKHVMILIIIFISLDPIFALNIGIHVPEKYAEIMAGQRIYFEVDLKYPENPSRKDIGLEYDIVNKEGEIIVQSKIIKAIETQASFIDFIVIPGGTATGRYDIILQVTDYNGLNEGVRASFYVVGKETEQMTIYLILILIAIVFVGILVIINILIIKNQTKKVIYKKRKVALIFSFLLFFGVLLSANKPKVKFPWY